MKKIEITHSYHSSIHEIWFKTDKATSADHINDYFSIIVQLYPKAFYKNIDCKNIIFIPMYDHSRHWGLDCKKILPWIYESLLNSKLYH